MLKVMRARLNQGQKTIKFPKGNVIMPERFRGLPGVDNKKCSEACNECQKKCPTGAVLLKDGKILVDLGKCLFCLDCLEACPQGAISFSKDYRLAARKREDLIYDGTVLKLAAQLDKKMRSIFGRSLKLRQVSAGGCNGCELDTNVLNTIVFDLGRFGIQFVASPRHADGILVTGPVTQNMELALKKTYEAISRPKIVIAVGACAISGGPYIDHEEARSGAPTVLPVDLYIPGCPPHPLTILDGMLRLLGKIK